MYNKNNVIKRGFLMDFYSIFFHIIGDLFGFLIINLFITFNTKNHKLQHILMPFFYWQQYYMISLDFILAHT